MVTPQRNRSAGAPQAEAEGRDTIDETFATGVNPDPDAVADAGVDVDEDEDDPNTNDDEVEVREHVVARDEHGVRLDRLLVSLAGEFSRSHLQSLIERGEVQIDGAVQRTASRKVKVGQAVRVALQPTAESLAFRAEPMALDIVHEDEHLLVVHKPAGLVVHPAAGHWSGTLLNGLLAHHAGASRLPRAGIVHRLDKDTSGLMVVAKTLQAQTALVEAIASRRVKRVYVALAHGHWLLGPDRIEAPVGRDPVSRVRMAVRHGGKPARTDVEPLEEAYGSVAEAACALRCRLHTGRTHQIRVHMAHRKHPLVGDTLYGGRPLLGMARQALHAVELGFVHPMTGTFMAFAAPLPPDLAAAWEAVTGEARPPLLGARGLAEPLADA